MSRATQAYDFIIVGAGAAGCVLANRLTEDPHACVLVLEAGGRDLDPLIHIPLGLGKLYQHQLHDWRYVSEPEPHLNGRQIPLPRGKVLGGSSSINVMNYTRGDRGDFDRWARNGATGWSYDEVLPYFKKAETAEDGESESRGGSGPIGVQWHRVRDPLCAAWSEAAQAAGYRKKPDPTDGSPEGFGPTQYTIRNGRRSSTATAYLKPARQRPNLTVITRAQAARVVIDRQRACAVDYIDRDGRVARATAAREIILAGGAFNTPQLLMLSGIGPAAHLRAHGIDVLADLPVGQNLQDHLMVANRYARKMPGELQAQMRFDRMAVNMLRAYLFGSGFAASVPSGIIAFVKTEAGLDVPDLEFLLPVAAFDASMWFPGVKKPYADSFAITPVLLHPQSRGEVLLRSADPQDRVLIRPNFLSHPADLDLLRRGIKLGRELARQRALDAFRGDEMAPGAAVQSDADIDAYIRNNLMTVSHPSSTCAMGNGPDAVLDPQLRVRGIDGLRVVDASAMPDLVSAHICASVVMMAEKAADLIRET